MKKKEINRISPEMGKGFGMGTKRLQSDYNGNLVIFLIE